MHLISRWRTRRRVRIVPRLGWHDRAYVLPNTVVGDTQGERLVIDPAAPISRRPTTKGDLACWQAHLAARAVGNSRLAFAMSAAFVGPLLQLVNAESGGFHLVGSSSIGKTALAVAAGSVTGGGPNGNVVPWRTTSNGAEVLVSSHNDGFIVFDEIGQVEPNTAAHMIYMIANGQGKVRSDRTLSLRPQHEWHTIFLSTGEMTLEAKLSEAKLRIMAGQEVRLVSIPADAGAQLGAFEDLHGHPDAAALADHLKAIAAEHYGVAFHEFLRQLTADLEGSRDFVLACVEEFVKRHCPENSGGQVRRVYGRFALLAAAGELAVKFGVLPWPNGEATRSTAICASAWLAERGGVDQAEVLHGVASVRRFVQAHETDRFADLQAWASKTPNRAGFVRRKDGIIEYMMFDEAFREACGGVDPKLVAKELLRRDCLEPGENGRIKKKIKLPPLGTCGPRGPQPRMYVVTSRLMEDEFGD